MSSDELKWPANKVRDTFISYFEKHAKYPHTNWKSSPVVPHDDPTLLFANAGMNQFKPIFLGTVDPNSPFASMSRAANSQKCIRAGGKHNDLDDVGKDVYHHTFFEMLGTWSFGDYFKEEAIDMAFDLLVNVFGIQVDRLYATYFEGDAEKGLEADLEAKALWGKYLADDHIIPGNAKDNFWEMGDVGPCGPCSELHYDRIGGRNAASLVNMDDPDVLEIWNLVFMQFNRESETELRKLPASHVDTGMGFERITSALQDKRSNYDTDIFTPLFEAIQKETGARPYTALVGPDDKDGVDMAYRVVADHVRTLTFALTDGATPSFQGRGYVLRRILRRGVRYGKEKLGAKTGFISRIVDVVIENMSGAFPELTKNPTAVKETILEEEEAFARTLDKGLNKFRSLTKNLKAGDVLSGHAACTLYDTYGFPLDLTELMCEEHGLKVDVEGYHARLEELKEISRSGGASKKKSGVDLKMVAEQTSYLQNQGVVDTDDEPKYNWKTTGEGETVSGKVLAIYAGNNNFVDEAEGKQEVAVILDRTNFYAEAGGQVNDIGTLRTASGAEFTVEDVKKYAGFVLHIGTVKSGSIKVGDDVTTDVDYETRALTAKNHTATHLINCGIRKSIGNADQRGSLVDQDKLRFDFSAKKPLKSKDISKIEDYVNGVVNGNAVVYKKVCALEDAKKIKALRAVFGEVYPDPVRVVSVGAPVEDLLADPESDKWQDVSIEFCGGTHLDNAGECEDFVVISEEGIAKGIRRIIAYTHDKASKARSDGESLLGECKALGALSGQALNQAVVSLSQTLDDSTIPLTVKEEIRKKIDDARKKYMAEKKALSEEKTGAAVEVATKLAEDATASGNKYIVAFVDVLGQTKGINTALEAFSKAAPSIPALFYSTEEEKSGKLTAIAIVPKEQTSTISASEWVNATVAVAGGKGGGKPLRAQGAARDTPDFDAVGAAAESFAASKFA